MAEVDETPPFDHEIEIEDDDDLFSDTSEKQSAPESDEPSNLDINESNSQNTPEDEDKKDDVEEQEDFFEGVGSEIKLDSDEEEHDDNEELHSNFKTSDTTTNIPERQISASDTTKPKAKVIIHPQISFDANSDVGYQKQAYDIEIKIAETFKMGEGMSAYIVYKVCSKTTNPAFKLADNAVLRRFSDFLGLHAKLTEKHVPLGVIVPPAPEKSVIGMTKVKMSKEDATSSEFIEKRRAALERYLMRTAMHPSLANDPDFIEFLAKDGGLPKSSNTSALSGAGVRRLFHKVGESFEKITVKVDESDEWFEEKQQQVEALDQQLKKLQLSIEILSLHRRELSVNAALFAKSAAMLGNVEEHTALSRALSQLAETEEKMELLHKEQSEADYFIMSVLMKDYVGLMAAVKDVFHERIKTYKLWKDAEATLGKKREMKAKLEMQNKMDKISQAQTEVTEWERNVEKGQEEFETISTNIKKEMLRFDKLRISDFRDSMIRYLEVLRDDQEKVIKYWEAFFTRGQSNHLIVNVELLSMTMIH